MAASRCATSRHLAKRYSDAQREAPRGQPPSSGTCHPSPRWRGAARLLDALLGEQRTFDLHEMYVRGRRDAPVRLAEANASAVAAICGPRPISFGAKTRVRPTPMQALAVAASDGLLAAEHRR